MRRIPIRIVGAMIVAGAATAAMAADVGPGDVKFKDGAVMSSLTGQAGDPASGRALFVGRKKGNCLACHENGDAKDQLFHGEVGPSLDGVSGRWTTAELRGIVTNAKMMFDDTIMPAFYNVSRVHRPLKKFAGTTILSAQQVEDVVAYLKTLK